jgi:formylglycine-generating enzyme required for sulfatase activity
VSKWEAGGGKIHPRPVNQAALDSSLTSSSSDVQVRFTRLTPSYNAAPSMDGSTSEIDPTAAALLRAEQNRVRHPVDGNLMTLVDAGVFLFGTNNKPVFLPPFYIDVFPTTNADYARFIAATGHRSPQHWSKDGNPSEDLLDHPVVFVTWHDAAAYAAWTGKSLPSSEQWEKAARGTKGDTYPWGSQLTPAKCNVRETDVGTTTPVDRYHSGVSPYGAYDMCGNVWEWLSTESLPGRYELKAGAFTRPFRRATPSAFNDASANMLDDDTGFRCVTPATSMRGLLKITA